MCEHVNSIAFALLNEGRLAEYEAKAFASKSILDNIKSVLTEFRKSSISETLTDNWESQVLMNRIVDGALK
jgi:hypothetical protein